VTDAGLDFNRDVDDAEIVVIAKPSHVSGVVTDLRGSPLKAYTVAIFSDDRRLWTLPMSRYVRSARTDADGRFTVGELPPGAYHAVVAEALPDGEWAEPESLDKLRGKATAFSLADGEAKVLSLIFPPR
jgi:hypothetical protein